MSDRRPKNVPPEASGGAGGQWVLYRGNESFLWCDVRGVGVLVTHDVGDLETRWDTSGRLASRGNWATLPDGRSRRPHGEWEYGPEDGPIRRFSMWELGAERSRTWQQHGLSREGAIGQLPTSLHPIDVEVGDWVVRDGESIVQTIELGPAISDAELLAHAAMAEATLDAETLAELAGDDPPRDAFALCAAIRLAARLDSALLARIPVRKERWSFIPHSFSYSHDGAIETLRGGTFAARLHAAYWGTPWDEVLEWAGESLLERGRPHAALDFLDVAGAMRGKTCAARAAALVALGRDDEAVLPSALTPHEEALHAQLGDEDRAAALALADLLERGAGGASELAGKPRAVVLRAYAAREPAPARALAKLWSSVPNKLRETFRDDKAVLANGFVDDVSLWIDAETFLKYANDLWRLAPRATQLSLSYASGGMAQLAACSALRRYRALRFSDTYLFNGGAAHLAGSRFLAQLDELGLFGTCLYDEDLAPILATRAFPALTSLDLGNPREDQNYTLDGLRPIVNAPFAATLETLSIARRYFDAEVVDDVIAQLPRLTSVDLEGSDLGQDGCEALAQLPHRFVSLDLERCGIDAAAMAALAASPVLGPCTHLDLGGNPLGADGLVALARSPHLGNLQSLGLGGLDAEARPSAAFVVELARGLIPRSIRSLAFSLGSVGPRGAHAIANAQWPCLERLELYGNGLLDDGAIALFQSPMLRTVRYLDLGQNDLTDVSGVALAESPHADGLAWIELGGALLEAKTKAALVSRFGDRLKLEYPWVRNSRRR